MRNQDYYFPRKKNWQLCSVRFSFSNTTLQLFALPVILLIIFPLCFLRIVYSSEISVVIPEWQSLGVLMACVKECQSFLTAHTVLCWLINSSVLSCLKLSLSSLPQLLNIFQCTKPYTFPWNVYSLSNCIVKNPSVLHANTFFSSPNSHFDISHAVYTIRSS